ncbi:MarR family transcriptional regulator [Pokkaliibacter plantistimulans]|nr:MarR family transcriptional regulator [Pokkaliibacter plantistimulans]
MKINMQEDHIDAILAQWAEERPDVNVASMGILGRISRISALSDRAVKDNHGRYQLHPGEFDVLATLRRSGAPYQLTPTALFKSALLTSGAMTNRLDKLERAGLVERTMDPSDRRSLLVRLTSSGIELIDEVLLSHVSTQRTLLSGLSDEEQSQLAALLRKWLIALEGSDPHCSKY